MFIVVATTRVFIGVLSAIVSLFRVSYILSWDATLTVLNALVPNHKPNAVIAPGAPGAGGLWPKYVAPKEGDSRCSCPALNALANHGILPHNGKNISFPQVTDLVHAHYNFAPSFSWLVQNKIAGFLERNYYTDTFDLSDIDVHNGIEHDASLARDDSYSSKNQGKPSIRRIEELLKSGTGPNGDLTPAGLSRLLGKTRAESKKNNPQYSQTIEHKLFGSSNASTLLTTFGGRLADIRTFLLEERIPEGWQPRALDRFGLTTFKFILTAVRVEMGIEQEE